MVKTGTQHIRLVIGDELVMIPGTWNMSIPEEFIFWTPASFQLHGLAVQPVGYLEINEARLLLYPEDTLPLLKECKKIGGEQPVYWYFRVITPAGSLKVIYLQAIVEEIAGKKSWTALLKEDRIELSPASAAPQGPAALSGPITEQFTDAGTWQINLHTHSTAYSANLFRIFEVIPGSLKAHPDTFRKFIHPDDKKIVSQTVDRSLREMIPFHLEYRIITESGRVKWVKHMSQVIRNESAEKVMIGVLRDVTELKHQELEIREARESALFQQEVLSALEKYTGGAYWQLNMRTRRISYSDNFYRLHGYKPQSMHPAYEYFLHTVHEDDRSRVTRVINDVLEGQLPLPLSYRILRPEGRTRYVEINTRVLLNPEKEPVLMAIVRDQTEEQQLNEQVTATEKENVFLRDAFLHQEELTGTGTWRTDLTSGITRFSAGFHRLFGLKSPTTVQNPDHFTKFIQEEEHARNRQAYLQMFTGQQSPHQLPVVLAEGHLKWLRMENKLLTNMDGSTQLIGTLVDTSREHMLAEELHNCNRISDLLSETVKDVYFVTDAHHNLLSYNKQFTDEYVTRETAVRLSNIFDVVPAMKHPDIVDNLNRAIRGEKIFLHQYRSCINGKFVNIHMLPLLDAHQRQRGVFTLVHDVSKEVQLQVQLQERARLMERLLEYASDRVVLLDENLHVLLWSRSCEVQHGLSASQVLNKSILEVFPAFKQDAAYEQWEKALAGETLPLPAVHTDGGEEGTGWMIPVYDENDRVQSVLWILYDREREVELSERQQKLSLILDSLGTGCFELDREQRFTYLNRTAASALALPATKLTGLYIWEIFPQLEETPLYNIVTRVLLENKEEKGTSAIGGRNYQVLVVPSAAGVLILFREPGEGRIEVS